MLQPNTFVMNPSLFCQIPYDPIASLAPIVQLATGELVLVVNPDIPARDARASVELARARPGALDYQPVDKMPPPHGKHNM